MNKEIFLVDRINRLRIDIQKRWFKKPNSSNSELQTHRDAEELIWSFQERFGYSGIKRDRKR